MDGGGGDARHDVAGALADETEHVEFRNHAFHHGEDRLVEGDVDHLTLSAVDLAVSQRHQRADHAPQGGDRVADGNPGANRRAVLEAGNVAQSAHRLADRAEARLVLVGAGLAEARQAHHHQARVQRVEDIPAQAELFQYAGAEVLDQDVGIAEQAFQDRLALGVLEIEGQGFLVACLNEPPQRGAFVELAPLAQWVAAVGRLDLDHFGAELGADPRGERAGDQGAELDHLQAGQRFGRMFHAVSVRLQCAHSLEHLPAVRAGAAVG